MSDLDLVGLRKIAEAAPSESEWVAEPIGAPDEGPTNHLIYEKRAPAGERVQYLVAWTDYDEAGWRFSEYIAAFDPPTALALLDRIEELEALEARLHHELDEMGQAAALGKLTHGEPEFPLSYVRDELERKVIDGD